MNDRELKNKLTIHAEVNAINNAHFKVKTLYVTRYPCHECAKFIATKPSIKKIIVKQMMGEKWAESNKLAAEIFEEIGVEVIVLLKKND